MAASRNVVSAARRPQHAIGFSPLLLQTLG
jgi:hypothetical protein